MTTARRQGGIFTSDGVPTDSAFGVAPPNGAICIDEVHSHLYARAGGSWVLVDFGGLAGPVARRVVASVAAGSDLTTDVCLAPVTGSITAVNYIPVSSVTGADTDTRTLTIKNLSTTKTAATLALVSGVNATLHAANALAVSGTAANVAVTAGDVIEFISTHSGSTGLADPGGLVEVTFQAS